MRSARLSQLRDSLDSATRPDDVQLILSLIDAEVEGGQVDSRWRVQTLGEVAEFFGLHLQTVKEWRAGTNPMPGSEGEWDIREIVRWRVDKLNTRARSGDESNNGVMREKIKVETEQKRLNLEEKRGLLVRRAATVAENREIFSTVRARLEALPGECASSVPADVRAAVMDEVAAKIRTALMELGRLGQQS